jgi:hypothetical protein
VILSEIKFIIIVPLKLPSRILIIINQLQVQNKAKQIRNLNKAKQIRNLNKAKQIRNLNKASNKQVSKQGMQL